MIDLLKKIYSQTLILKKLFKIPSYYWSKIIHRNNIPVSEASYIRGNKIFLKEFDLALTPDTHVFFLKQYHLAKKLKTEMQARFINNNPGEIMVILPPEIKIILKTYSDFFILEEIFLNGIYNLVDARDINVWDIGCNIGIASLFFAQKENVKKIFSYEPFIRTFSEAKKNFDLNPLLNKKITVENSGISDEDKQLDLEYSFEYKANVGVMGLSNNLKSGPSPDLEKIKLRSAPGVLREILKSIPPQSLVVKMDCEGSEYEIVKSLAANDLLKHVRAFLIEWHYQGPSPLEDYLNANGFVSISLFPNSKNSGFIYSVNSNKE